MSMMSMRHAHVYVVGITKTIIYFSRRSSISQVKWGGGGGGGGGG